jgi:HD superfamily phosphodiesterase
MKLAPLREYVVEACQRPENVFGPSFFEEHLAVVAECGSRLAARLQADANIVELAAYLHDLSAVCDPATLPVHAEASADVATRVLNERGYPTAVVARTAGAIRSHSTPLPIGGASPEAVCLSNADAAARMLRPAYWLYFAFKVRNLGFEEGRRWLRALIERQWGDMIEPARELVGAQYSKVMELVS